jgi:hypothetical protein
MPEITRDSSNGAILSKDVPFGGLRLYEITSRGQNFPKTPTFAGGNSCLQQKIFPQYLGTELTNTGEQYLS